MAFNIPGERIDGMDVEAVCDAGARARVRAVVGQGPTILEMETYRYPIRSSSRLTWELIAGWLEPKPVTGFRQTPGLGNSYHRAYDLDRDIQMLMTSMHWPPESTRSHLQGSDAQRTKSLAISNSTFQPECDSKISRLAVVHERRTAPKFTTDGSHAN
jgi:hypothetical protein